MQAAIGMNKEKNPVVAKMAGKIGLVLHNRFTTPRYSLTIFAEMVKVVLSLVRSVFNLFTWRDPYMTFLFQGASFTSALLLIVFPWRLFFFVMGLGLVGPQVSPSNVFK